MLYHYQRRMENPGDATHVPLTLGGKAGSAWLPMSLAATFGELFMGFQDWRYQFSPVSFKCRTNSVWIFFEFKIQSHIDFAHNASSYKGVEGCLQAKWKCYQESGIIAGVGDRRDEDIRECAI
jgi:cyanophycin synthetase